MDKVDREILGILRVDGRRSYTELAESVNLSANAVAERVKRLLRAGTIRHIRASVDPAALGHGLEAQIDVTLQTGVPATRFEAALREIPQVQSAAVMTGSFDYALRVACADREELFRLVERLREHAGARETYSRLILHEVELGGP
ncbi:MAG: Lrp/AsnC family transcriptional regulator [Betaproteobacteria bacterium]|jgi:Lrp/AsnC family leucine-responsive transcriptional regulator|nr:Lrp/AsnC family transcriptional regulator [Betaproteobacteria bacterium]